MRSVAEIEIVMTPSGRDEVRSRRHGLRLQCFERRIGSTLGLNYRCHRRLQVHLNNRNQNASNGFQLKHTVVSAADFSRNGEHEVGHAIAAAGRV